MAVQPIPEGYHTVVPYLIVPDVAKELEFIDKVFGAKVVERLERDGSVQHADVLIGDSHVMMGAASEQWPARLATLHLYVDNCDELYRKAMAAGATSLREPTNEFYGDRSGGVTDPQGNQWWFATHVEDVSQEEMERRAAKYWK